MTLKPVSFISTEINLATKILRSVSTALLKIADISPTMLQQFPKARRNYRLTMCEQISSELSRHIYT